MRGNLKYIDFGDVFSIKMGKTPSRNDKTCWDDEKKTNNKWVSIADITKNEGKIIYDTKEYISDSAASQIYKVTKGSLLMSFKLTIGKMAFAGYDLYTNEAIISISENNKYDLKFLYYYLLFYPWNTLTDGSEKVKGKTLNKSSISKIKLPILEIFEQRCIVELLDAEFAKIDAIKANAEKQLQWAKDLFQSALKDLLTPKDGWEMVSIGDKFKTYSGGTPLKSHKEYYENGKIPWINSGEVAKKYIYCCSNFISEEGLRNSSAKYFPFNTVLVAMYGATAAQAGILKFEATSNQAVCGLLPNKDFVPEFVYYWFLLNKEKFAAMAQGGAQPNLSQIKIKAMKIPLISLQEQEYISEILGQIESKIYLLEENFQETVYLCNDLKQSLLKDIFA